MDDLIKISYFLLLLIFVNNYEENYDDEECNMKMIVFWRKKKGVTLVSFVRVTVPNSNKNLDMKIPM